MVESLFKRNQATRDVDHGVDECTVSLREPETECRVPSTILWLRATGNGGRS